MRLLIKLSVMPVVCDFGFVAVSVVPLFISAPWSGDIHAARHHSESNKALFPHIPGVSGRHSFFAGSPYGLLLAAIRDPDSVIFFEPKRIYDYQTENPLITAKRCRWILNVLCCVKAKILR